MASLLRMPEISANTVEAVLAEWPLAENAEFATGDAIATVETEKAIVDVPADAAGVLLRTLIEPGKSVPVGAPMAVLGAPGEVVDDIEALVRQLTGDAVPSPPAGPAEPAAANGSGGAGGSLARIFASPLARRMAKENGLAVGDIHGTGPGGRIIRDDVKRAVAERSAAVPNEKRGSATVAAGRPADGLAAVPGPAGRQSAITAPGSRAVPPAEAMAGRVPDGVGADHHDVPHSRMRRAIAKRLTQSHDAPVFSIRGSAQVDALLAIRKDLNEGAGVKISLNDLIVAAAARAHGAVPEMNVIWMPDAVRRFNDVDIAIAVATETGLVTPVVRGAQRLTVSALAAQSAELVSRARDGRLRQDDLEGGTLTVTNLGVYGTEDFTAVINPPQTAVLAVGAARQEPVVTGGELGVATVLRVTLSVDHRPVDGATAARWMAAFLGLVRAPLRILA